MDNKRVFITGVGGFIGSHLARHLLDCGYEVYGVYRNSNISLNESNKRLHIFRGDLREKSITDIIGTDESFDFFFHLAYEGVSGEKKKDYKVQLSNAMLLCDMVVAAAQLKCRRFINIGSIDEFEAYIKPDGNYIPASKSLIYGAAKNAGNVIARTLAYESNIEYVSAFLSLTYGIGNNSDIIPNVLIKNCMAGKKTCLISGKQLFDMIYIDEAIEAIATIAEKGTNMEGYYVGHEILSSFREVMSRAAVAIGYDNSNLLFGEYNDNPRAIDWEIIDRGKLFRDTGYQCSLSIDEGMKKTFLWMKNKCVLC